MAGKVISLVKMFAKNIRRAFSGPSDKDTMDMDFVAVEGATIPGVNAMEELNTRFGWVDNGASITYDFPDNIRNNIFSSAAASFITDVQTADRVGQYGASNMTFERLYRILTDRFNGGVPFVDTYFDTIFPYSWVKEEFDIVVARIREEVMEEAAQRQGEDLRIEEFAAWSNQQHHSALQEVRLIIKQDIVSALYTGKINLKHITSAETLARRRALGLNVERTFYASGQLIESINIYIALDKEAA